ncbi:hypothetical protein D3C85_899400 [compost metagenome]
MAVAPKPSSTAKWCGSRTLAVSTRMLASQRRLLSTRVRCTAPTAMAAGMGRVSALMSLSDSTSSTVPLRALSAASAQSRSSAACSPSSGW